MTLWNAPFGFEMMAVDWVEIGILAACFLVALLAIAVWGLCVWAAWQGLRRKQQAIFPLRLTSQSNLHTRFRLRVELGDLQKTAAAFWLQDGSPLAGKTIKHYRYVQETRPQPAAPAKTKAAANPVKKKQQDAQAGAKKIGFIANLVASLTGTLAALLPGPLKTPFRAINTAIRERQKDVSQVKAEVSHLQSTSRSLDNDMKRLGNATGVKGSGNGGKPAAAGVDSYQRVVTTEIPVTETAPFEPAASSVCRLVIRPKNPLRSLSGSFQVESRPVELKEYPIYGVIPSSTLSADLNIQAVLLHRILFAALVAGLGSLCLWGSLALIRWLLLFR